MEGAEGVEGVEGVKWVEMNGNAWNEMKEWVE